MSSPAGAAQRPSPPAHEADPQRLAAEADRITRRLTGVPATPEERERYAAATARIVAPLDDGSARLWELMMRRPRTFSFIDAGLALLDPTGPVRQRLLVMLAILEASPTHADLFLPQTERRAAPWGFLAGAAGGAGRAAVGVPLVLILRRCAR